VDEKTVRSNVTLPSFKSFHVRWTYRMLTYHFAAQGSARLGLNVVESTAAAIAAPNLRQSFQSGEDVNEDTRREANECEALIRKTVYE
jgi:hypothetical protein